MIKLEIKQAPTLGTPSDHFFVDVMGVGEEKRFGVFPRLHQSMFSDPTCSNAITMSPLYLFSQRLQGYHLLALVLHVTSLVG